MSGKMRKQKLWIQALLSGSLAERKGERGITGCFACVFMIGAAWMCLFTRGKNLISEDEVKAAGENDVEERKSLGEWARIPKKGESGKEKGLVGLCRDGMCEGSEKVIQVIGYNVFVDLRYMWDW